MNTEDNGWVTVPVVMQAQHQQLVERVQKLEEKVEFLIDIYEYEDSGD